MTKTMLVQGLISLLLLSVASCGAGSSGNAAYKDNDGAASASAAPVFVADSAYRYVKEQVGFGPRVPNTKAHLDCGAYLAAKLKAFGAKVTDQRADLVAYDGTRLAARNIIGSFAPEKKKRVLLCAHWDTRPFADNDPDEANHHTPILGADDGASGVGVLLEIARLIGKQSPALGVDIVLFDAEDYGAPYFFKGEHRQEYWCLGAQHWARWAQMNKYNARFGVLLDMVGGQGATFYWERYSDEFARSVNRKVWKKAQALGYGRFFVEKDGTEVTDDHLFVNRIARIPCIDIITYVPGADNSFGDRWHTVNDNMDGIAPATLQAVGQTVLGVVYDEK